MEDENVIEVSGMEADLYIALATCTELSDENEQLRDLLYQISEITEKATHDPIE